MTKSEKKSPKLGYSVLQGPAIWNKSISDRSYLRQHKRDIPFKENNHFICSLIKPIALSLFFVKKKKNDNDSLCLWQILHWWNLLNKSTEMNFKFASSAAQLPTFLGGKISHKLDCFYEGRSNLSRDVVAPVFSYWLLCSCFSHD